MDGVSLSFSENCLDFIVDKAIEFKLGARGLRSICEAIMVDLMFDVPSSLKKPKSVTINLSYAEEKLNKSKLKKLKAA